MDKYTDASKLFMNESDIEGLELLYKMTNDELVKILLDWKTNILELENNYTNEFSMYEDILAYVFKKYDL